MTYKVSSGTLNLCSLTHSLTLGVGDQGVGLERVSLPPPGNHFQHSPPDARPAVRTLYGTACMREHVTDEDWASMIC